MILVEPTKEPHVWFSKEDKPQCVSCNLYVVNFHGTKETVVDGLTRIICRACSSAATCSEYDSVEALREDTGGEERGRAVTEAIAAERRSRANEFQQERAEKAARKKAKKKKSRSRSRDEGSDSESAKEFRVRQPKKTRGPKVRSPKRRPVSDVDIP